MTFELADILAEVCRFYNQDILKVKSKSREPILVNTRQVYFYFGEIYSVYSQSKIAAEVACDHATLIHGRKTVLNKMETERFYRANLLKLEKKIKSMDKEYNSATWKSAMDEALNYSDPYLYLEENYRIEKIS